MRKTRSRACRRASELISLSMDRPLTRRERIELTLHTTVCRPCRVFRRQLARIRSLLRDGGIPNLRLSLRETRLPDEARARVQERLRAAR